jgi:monovalent cation:H+ antiporter-2, CPA2 family
VRRGYATAVLEEVLVELSLLFALCVGVAVTFHRFRLPPIVGFLVAGVVVGPYTVGLVKHAEMVRDLAEVGIVVLLFAVGLEVPLGQLARLRRTIFTGGGLQIVLTIAATAAVACATGMGWQAAVFLGFLLSLSSTAASTKMLVDHGELSTPHGRVVLGIAIAQDLVVVPMILLIPLLGSGGDGGASPVDALKNLVMLVGVVAVAKLLVRPLVGLVCRTRNRELFVLFLATWCLGLAVVTAHLGLSLALGAFLAGILLADTDHHSQAVAEIEPFRDAFASLFFVSIGMLFDWRTIAEQPGTVLAIVLAVVGGKGLIVMGAVWWLGQPFWVRVRAALTLAQVGEFSFVLVQLGKRTSILPASAEALFVVAAVVSIAATPLLYALGRVLAQCARQSGDGGKGDDDEVLRDHAIIVGFGPTGRTVAAGLEAAGIPFVVAEMNAMTVRAEKANRVPIVLGDATRVTMLHGLGIARARIVVLAVNDLAATQRIAQLARLHAPHAHVIARAVFNNEVVGLRAAGAHEVVPQELEASVEIMVRTLRRFLVADDEIGRQVRQARDEAGGIDRAAPTAKTTVADLAEFVPGIGFAVWKVADGAPSAGQSLAEVGVRRLTGCSVVAVRRDGMNLGAITPDTVLEHDDTVVVIGPEHRLADAAAMFHSPAPDSPAPDDISHDDAAADV